MGRGPATAVSQVGNIVPNAILNANEREKPIRTIVTSAQPYCSLPHLPIHHHFAVMREEMREMKVARRTRSAECPAANLMSEAHYILSVLPNAKTFIIEHNDGTPDAPVYGYSPANTPIALFGLDPYPIRPQFQAAQTTA